MNPLRSVGGRLIIALLLVVAGALGVAYLVVVPRLENQLIDSRLQQLQQTRTTVYDDAYRYSGTTEGAFGEWQRFVTAEAGALGVRVVLYSYGERPIVVASSPGRWDPGTDPVATRYPTSGKGTLSTHVGHGGQRYGEVAFPSPSTGGYFVVSKSIEDTFASVNVVKRRLLLAGLVILVVALVAAFAAARVFARRIRRLERAADRIAAGHFDEPVVDTGKD